MRKLIGCVLALCGLWVLASTGVATSGAAWIGVAIGVAIVVAVLVGPVRLARIVYGIVLMLRAVSV
jgi:hypothetical protein